MTPVAPPIGFIILSHGKQSLLMRLIRRLNDLYDRPPIACHHDFSQAPLDARELPANVMLVNPHFDTGWGKATVVRAGLAAMRLLVDRCDPDWCVLLSAADYPVRAAAKVLGELQAAPYDAYLDAQPVMGQPAGAAAFSGQRNPKLGHFDYPSNRRLKWQFYIGARLWVPVVKIRPRLRLGRVTFPLNFAARTPFNDAFAAYYGDHWFTANRRAASALVGPTPDSERLMRHLTLRAQADECYYQTVLANTPGLRICLDNKRYAEWNGGGAHPVMVEPKHVPAILASGAHFARKFALESPAIDAIDAAVDAHDRYASNLHR